MKNFYELLDVFEKASFEEIKKAYKSQALRYHPDRHEPQKKQWAEGKFKEISLFLANV